MQNSNPTDRLIINHEKRLWKLRERRALLGLSADVSVDIEIEQIEEEIAALRAPQLEKEIVALQTPQLKKEIAALQIPQPAPRILFPEPQQPLKHKGLIMLVGIGRVGQDPVDSLAVDTIAYHTKMLEHCWMIALGGTDSTLDAATYLKYISETRGITTHIWSISDPFNVAETYDIVQRLFTYEIPKSGLEEHDVICDFTGGTKPMTVGMILACGTSRTIQYMMRQAHGSSVPVLIQFGTNDGA